MQTLKQAVLLCCALLAFTATAVTTSVWLVPAFPETAPVNEQL